MRDRRARHWWWADNAIWDVRVSALAKLVYLNLCRRADGEGRSFPSLNRIGEDCGTSKRSVQNACRELREAGLIRVVSGQAQAQANEYEIMAPDVAPTATFPLQAVSASGGMVGTSGPKTSHQVPPGRHQLPARLAPGAHEVRSIELDPRKGRKSRSRAVVMTDDQFLEELKKNPAYKGIDVDREMGKLDAWLLTPKGFRKKKTRGRMVNWLNGVDQEQSPSKVSAEGKPVITFPDLSPEIAALVVEFKRSEPGTSLADLVEKAKREQRRRKEG